MTILGIARHTTNPPMSQATSLLLEAVQMESPCEIERAFTEALRDGADFSQLPKSSRALRGLLMIFPYCRGDNIGLVQREIDQQIRSDIKLDEEGVFLEELQKKFGSAIRLKNYNAVVFFLVAGLKLNFEIHGMNPLKFAICHSSEAIIRLLCSEGETMGSIPLAVRDQREPRADLVAAFPLSSDDYAFLNTKAIAHFYNIIGRLPDGNGRLEGSFSTHMVPYLTDALEQFQGEQIGRDLQTLTDASRESHRPERTAEEMAAKIQAGELCFVHTGWSGHAITLAFFDGYMAICNRGSGSITRGTLKVYKIDLSMVGKDLFRLIRNNSNVSSSNGAQFLYQELPEILCGVQDEVCREFVKVAPKWQKIGVCSLASPKAAIRFAWIMIVREQGVEHPFEVGRDESKAFTEFAAQNLLEKHGENMVTGFQEMVRFRAAVNYKQWRTRVRAHPNRLIRGVGRVAGWVMSVSLPILSLIASGGQA